MHLRGNAAEEPMDREKTMFIQQGRERERERERETEDAFVLCRVLDHTVREKRFVSDMQSFFLSFWCGEYLTHRRDYRDVFEGGETRVGVFILYSYS